MQCLKCGREIEPEQAFCPDCLTEMDKYPVKPGTVVHIPQRLPQNQAKKAPAHRHPVLPAEEMVKKLKKRVVALTLALILALAALTGLIWLGAKQYFEEGTSFLPGQNYSSAGSTATDPHH